MSPRRRGDVTAGRAPPAMIGWRGRRARRPQPRWPGPPASAGYPGGGRGDGGGRPPRPRLRGRATGSTASAPLLGVRGHLDLRRPACNDAAMRLALVLLSLGLVGAPTVAAADAPIGRTLFGNPVTEVPELSDDEIDPRLLGARVLRLAHGRGWSRERGRRVEAPGRIPGARGRAQATGGSRARRRAGVVRGDHGWILCDPLRRAQRSEGPRGGPSLVCAAWPGR